MLATLQAFLAYRHPGRHMVLDARIRLALIAGSVVLLSASDCDGEKNPRPSEPVLLPSVASIEIVPSNVSVPTGTSFTLRAQLRDSWGTVLSDTRTESVSWGTTRGPAVSPGPSSSVVVNTPAAGGSTATSTIVVVASLNTLSATATIEVVPATPPTGPAMDWIRAPHYVGDARTPPDLPTIALVDGPSAGSQSNDATFAFAGSRDLDAFDCNGAMCGEITIFSPTLGIRRDPVGWSVGCDFVDFAGNLGGPSLCQSTPASKMVIPLPQRVRVPVTIWNASIAPNVDGLIAQDTAYALEVFHKAWTGLTLDVTVAFANAPTEMLIWYSSCQDPEYDITRQLLGIPDTAYRPDRINVAYVDEISSLSGYQIGFTCEYDTVEGSIILLSNKGLGGSTLAHELGHAIGQWVADSTEHPDEPFDLPGFDESNVMWSVESDETLSLRSHLTLGQLFQMSLRDSSFVKRSGISPGPGLPCPPKPGSDTPCPRLAKDMIR